MKMQNSGILAENRNLVDTHLRSVIHVRPIKTERMQ